MVTATELTLASLHAQIASELCYGEICRNSQILQHFFPADHFHLLLPQTIDLRVVMPHTNSEDWST